MIEISTRPKISSISVQDVALRREASHFSERRTFTDIDLLLEAAPPIDFSTQAKLAHELEESNLPFKVDLIPLEQLYLPYAQQIQSEKKLLFQF